MSEESQPPEPRETYELVGHEAAEATFAEGFARGRLHHAWMIVGPRGIGKASFAYRAARRVLGAKPSGPKNGLGSAPDDPVCSRIEAGAHGDLLVLSPPYDPKKGAVKRDIPVDEARRASTFFGATAAEGGWRVAIVDAVDEMNTNAANALLKTLEEPPERGLVLLVCHAPGRTLATIRSRCRQLSLRAPGVEAATQTVLATYPDAGHDAQAAAELAQGRPGEAVRLFAADGVKLHGHVQALTEAGARSRPTGPGQAR